MVRSAHRETDVPSVQNVLEYRSYELLPGDRYTGRAETCGVDVVQHDDGVLHAIFYLTHTVVTFQFCSPVGLSKALWM